MVRRMIQGLHRRWRIVLLLALLGGYWLLSISGQVAVIWDTPGGLLWPQMRLESPSPRPGQEVTLRVMDVVPWTCVLLTVNGAPAQPRAWPLGPGDNLVWEWTFEFPEGGPVTLVFYHDCHTGCRERGRMSVGGEPVLAPAGLVPTKLGVVFANPERDWHGRSGWDVELTYVRLAEEPYWGIDDLAARVHRAREKGLRVLVRVDYDQGQSLPPVGDHLALTEYLEYLRRLVWDERLRSVYGYFLGSGYNGRGVTPGWYARVFNGYGEAAYHGDNAVQVMRGENPQVRVLVGPVQPWNTDQGGSRRYRIDVPWLNYMGVTKIGWCSSRPARTCCRLTNCSDNSPSPWLGRPA